MTETQQQILAQALKIERAQRLAASDNEQEMIEAFEPFRLRLAAIQENREMAEGSREVAGDLIDRLDDIAALAGAFLATHED